MNKFYLLHINTKVLIILTVVLLLYGYLCRIFNLYFFWEAKPIAWNLVLITIIFLLRERMFIKKTQERKTTSEKVAIVLIIVIILFETIFAISIFKSDVYKTANHYFQTDQSVSEEVGTVTNIILIPVGSYSTSTSSTEQSGQADLYYILKGKKKYKDYNIRLVKETNSDWKVIKNK